MGILDEAIKEHLELKRQHGAGESELKQLEDEAFGEAERPGAERGGAGSLRRGADRVHVRPGNGGGGACACGNHAGDGRAGAA